MRRSLWLSLAGLMVAFVLAACASAESRKAELDASDDAKCQAHGYQPGTLTYTDCRDKLAEMRDQGDRSALAGRLLGHLPGQ